MSISDSTMSRFFLAAAGLMAVVGATPVAMAQGSFGPYVPTPTVIVDRLLDMGAVTAKDYLIDLGSGDGRIVITAAKKFGASGHGIDIQEKLVAMANQNAAKEGVADRVKFMTGDIMEADLSRASVITTYLLPSTITKLVPKFLAELKPGTRIVSHDYPISPLVHEKVVSFDLEEKVKISGTTLTVIYLYVIPARVSGEWNLNLALPGTQPKPLTVRFEQRPDSLTGSVDVAGGDRKSTRLNSSHT